VSAKRNQAILAHQVQILGACPLVVFDVETTGLSAAKGERVIEIGAVRVVAGQFVERFSSLVATSRPIAPGAQVVHGISAAMLEGQPEAGEVFSSFRSFIGEDLLVAHNAHFDIGFLEAEFARMEQRLGNSYYCTLKLSRLNYPHLRSHKLEILGRYLFGELPGVRHHRALDDAELAARVLLQILRDNGGTGSV